MTSIAVESQSESQPDINQLASTLHAARIAAEITDATLQLSRDAWELENAELIASKVEAHKLANEADDTLREALVARYEETQEKHFGAGCAVRVSELYDYQVGAALTWAKVNARIAVVPESLNCKVFEGFCKDEKLRPDFVIVSEKVTATIPRDLSKYLEELPQGEG